MSAEISTGKSLAEMYREKAAECEHLARSTKSLREGNTFRKQAAAYRALSETEDWLAGHVSPVPQPTELPDNDYLTKSLDRNTTGRSA